MSTHLDEVTIRMQERQMRQRAPDVAEPWREEPPELPRKQSPSPSTTTPSDWVESPDHKRLRRVRIELNWSTVYLSIRKYKGN